CAAKLSQTGLRTFQERNLLHGNRAGRTASSSYRRILTSRFTVEHSGQLKKYRPALITASAIRRRAAIDFIDERCASSSIVFANFSSSISLATARADCSTREAAS